MSSQQQGWNRLPLIALLAFLISSIRIFIRFLYQAVPALVGVYIALRNHLHYVPYVAAGLFIFLLVATFLRYRRFLWQFDDQRIRVKQGVFKVTELNLGYERIQQADIRQPFWLKPFNLTVLSLQSAGSKGKEVEIPALSETLSAELQQRVLAKAQAAGAAENSESPDVVAENDFELKLPTSEVWRIGSMQNIFIMVSALVAFIFANQTMTNYITEQFELWLAGFESQFQALLVGSAMVLGFFFGILVLTTLYYFNQFYGYHLVRQGDRVHYQAGLLSKLSRSFRMPKLQLIEMRQGLVGRALRRWSVRILQAGANHEKAEGRFTVPILNVPRLEALTQDLQLTNATWQRVHIGFLFRYWLIIGVVVGAIFDPIAGAMSAAVVLVWRWVWWRRFGWHVDPQWLVVRTAWIGQRQRWVPAAKMQRVSIQQSPWQRLFGCCQLRADTAGGSLTVPWLRQETAQALKAELLELTATNNKRWM
ncbi:MAG: PH domain-containing protein [Gammaproteobacteria bacterium]|nr:PH domain-containing protein [Gammaproteobacteria bacterium]MCL5255297.1 PH domain-containing protein [Gammaproteobacteria bacterium]